jgi:hypothetical protein
MHAHAAGVGVAGKAGPVFPVGTTEHSSVSTSQVARSNTATQCIKELETDTACTLL